MAAKVIAASKDGIHGMSDPVWMGAFFMPGAFLTVRKPRRGETVLNTRCMVLRYTCTHAHCNESTVAAVQLNTGVCLRSAASLAVLQATQQTAAKVLESSMEQLQMIVDVVEDEGNPFDEGRPAGSQYLITGVFLEAATWENGALALTNQMLNRMPTVKITWLVQDSLVRRCPLPVL